MGTTRRELLLVFAVILLVSLFLWWRFLPLPHLDLNFYTEPAYLLARYGTLAGPGSQYIDLTYQKGLYFYPPGYFLVLAAWIKVFGLSSDSLLGYTHAIHVAFLVALWVLLRRRYSCTVTTSALVLLAVFPAINHGRPDLTAALLSVAAWLALPARGELGRFLLSGFLVGATMLVSPAYGIGIASTLAAITFTDSSNPLAVRTRSFFIWAGTAGLVLAAVLSIVLSEQNAWTLAYVQFKSNVAIRGHELNTLPNLRTPFAWTFSIIPFLLVALVPAFVAVLFTWRNRQTALRSVSLAFLAGTAVWFALNKAQLLYEHHYLLVSKVVFLGVLCSLPKFPRWARPLPLLLLAAISFYKWKADFLYLGSPLRDDERKHAASTLTAGEIAVDSLYFARLYRPGRSLNYECYDLAYWPRYLTAIPQRFQDAMLSDLPRKPLEPSMLVVSAATVQRLGEPHFQNMQCTAAPPVGQRLKLLGRTWKLPADPYALVLCSATGHEAAVTASVR